MRRLFHRHCGCCALRQHVGHQPSNGDDRGGGEPDDATVYEGGEGVNAGSDGLSRVPDGGAALDQQFVMQALSPGTSNVLGCEEDTCR